MLEIYNNNDQQVVSFVATFEHFTLTFESQPLSMHLLVNHCIYCVCYLYYTCLNLTAYHHTVISILTLRHGYELKTHLKPLFVSQGSLYFICYTCFIIISYSS